MKQSEKYANLVDRLIAKTAEGLLNWELMNGDVACKLGDFYIFLTESRNSEGEPFEHIEMKDATEFQIVDKFTDVDLNGFSRQLGKGNGFYYDRMTGLRKAAFRKAVGADDALDAVLKELE